MADTVDALLVVVRALEGLGISYFVGGSIASAAYGTVRTTLDADIVARMQDDDVSPFAAALGADFYLDTAMIRDAIAHRHSFNLIHIPTMFKIDIFVPRDRLFTAAQFERCLPSPIGSGRVVMSSPEDTVLAKLESYRLGPEVSQQQWRDVLGILSVQAQRLDFAYMDHWAAQLGLAALLDRARRKAAV
jgi:hypothetical protein